jgi:hypothetical protein
MNINYIINLTNELVNNLHSDISNSQYVFRPINSNYIYEDISRNNTFSSSNLQNFIHNNTPNDLSFIAIATISNDYNNPRAITIRNLLRTLYVNYYEENEDNTFETFINSTFENKTKFKKVISDSELEKLKPQKFNKINETETNIECPILYYNFEENEEIIKLPCNHNYNCDAILKWLSQESNTCPVCRYEFDYKEINIDNKRQTTNVETTNVETTNVETTNDYDLFSNEEILIQESLLNSYSNNNYSNNNYSNM